jgi:hypothetical protein
LIQQGIDLGLAGGCGLIEICPLAAGRRRDRRANADVDGQQARRA